MPEDMKCVRRTSVVEEFQVSPNNPIPPVPTGGARVKVLYAGACYTDKQVCKSGKRRPKMAGVMDTSLFPGYEVSGKIDAICNTVEDSQFEVGHKVIVYPEDEEEPENGYAEYIVVKNIQNLIRVPETISMEVAAMLPTGGLIAYNTIMRIKPVVDWKITNRANPTTILIVGAGGLGLWMTRLANHYLCTDCSKVRIVVADTNIDKLMLAKEHGCSDVLHWNDTLHEEYLLERTKNVCGGAVDLLIDFVSSPRTTNRSLKVLAPEGVLVVGGNTKYEVSFCLHSLAIKQQTVMGVSKGSREQLSELVEALSTSKINPPAYSIFPVDEANKVFEQLNQCKIAGRAVLQVCPVDEPTQS